MFLNTVILQDLLNCVQTIEPFTNFNSLYYIIDQSVLTLLQNGQHILDYVIIQVVLFSCLTEEKRQLKHAFSASNILSMFNI